MLRRRLFADSPQRRRDDLPLRRLRSEEHTSELQSRSDLVCRLLLEKKKTRPPTTSRTRRRRPARVPSRGRPPSQSAPSLASTSCTPTITRSARLPRTHSTPPLARTA